MVVSIHRSVCKFNTMTDLLCRLMTECTTHVVKSASLEKVVLGLVQGINYFMTLKTRLHCPKVELQLTWCSNHVLEKSVVCCLFISKDKSLLQFSLTSLSSQNLRPDGLDSSHRPMPHWDWPQLNSTRELSCVVLSCVVWLGISCPRGSCSITTSDIF